MPDGAYNFAMDEQSDWPEMEVDENVAVAHSNSETDVPEAY
jgi:hypothetical protein